MSANDNYAVLMEHLGYASSARLRLIMEELMTPDEARMVVELPGTAEEVAEKTGFDTGRVKDTLDSLFFKGVIFPRGDFRRRGLHRFARSIGQFHDATMATQQLDLKKDRRLFEVWYDFIMKEWYPDVGEARRGSERRAGQRIVPAYKSIKELPGVLPHENYPEMLKAQELIATVPCSCRLNTASVGEPCAVHDEVAHWVCFQFGRGADYVIARGSGKELSVEEVLELSDICEDSGLIHLWPNNSTMTAPNTACQCCRDCCMTYIPMDMTSQPMDKTWEKSRYEAYVNLDDCNGCQVCVDRCLFDAIEMVRPEGSKKYKAVVDPEKCFGCGVCVVGCEPVALKMKVVRPPEHIPAPAPKA